MSLPSEPMLCCLGGVALLVLYFSHRLKRTPADGPASGADLALLIFVVLQVAPRAPEGLFTGAVDASIPLASGLCLYFAVQFLRPVRHHWMLLLRTITALAACIAAVDLIMLHREAVALTVFSNVSVELMRFEMPIAGYAPKNDNLMVVLLLLPLCMFAWINENDLGSEFRWPAALSAGAVLCVLALGFSRGIYLALCIFLAGFAFLASRRLLVLRELFLPGAGLLILVFLTTIAVLGPSRLFTSSTSQLAVSEHRSTIGRFIIWQKRLPVVRKHLLLGMGGGSDGLVSLATIASGPEVPFTAASYNLPLELLQTSGIAGLLCYAIFLFFVVKPFGRVFKGCTRSWEMQGMVILCLGLLAACVRELTYSSVITNPPSACLFLGICGATNALTTKLPLRYRHVSLLPAGLKTRHLAVVAALISEIAGFSGLSLQAAKADYVAGCVAFSSGDYPSALIKFNEARSHKWKNPLFDAAVGLTLARISLGSVGSTQLFASLLPPVPQPERTRLRAAKEALAAALDRSPHDATFWSNLGWIDSFLHDNQDAEMAFHRAIQSDPYDTPGLISLGLFYERLGHLSESEKLYARAIAVSPRVLRSPFWNQFESRRKELARRIVEDSIEMLLAESDSPIREARLGSIYAYIGKFNAARKEYIRAISALPDLSYAWSNLAYLEQRSQARVLRVSDLDKALLIDPSNVDAATQLAQLSLEAGNTATAERLYVGALNQPTFSSHAERVGRVYGLPPPEPDDLLPHGLLTSITPEVTFVAVCGAQLTEMVSHISVSTPLLDDRLERQERYCASPPDGKSGIKKY
jgi:tetratricopeptide (TPR) repeat protein/O-antigen ligase